MKKIICSYCGKVKEAGSMIAIGASLENDWTVWEGTGKISCPECWEKGRKEAQQVIQGIREGA